MAKIWKKTNSKIDKLTEEFTVGNDHKRDLGLIKHDVQASIVHAKMLEKIGILTSKEFGKIQHELDTFLKKSQDKYFRIKIEDEDIHTTIEIYLTKQLGEIGKKIHTGRSRNDQVLVAMHLYIKEKILDYVTQIHILANSLLLLSEKYKDNIIPGYTHTQVAMPSSIGLWLSSFAELLIDDLYYFETAYKIADQNPLGSAAGYGSSFPIDRELTTELLRFKQLKINVIAAQAVRGRVEKALGIAMSSVASTLSKLVNDIILFVGQNHNFISFPQQFTTGSSIMPHKKNPDVFELIRGRCNTVQALPNEITLLLNNLTTGYHRDLQELKDLLFPKIYILKNCLNIAIEVLPHLSAVNNIEKDDKYKYMYSVEQVNKLVMEGKSFREAYKIVGDSIENGDFKADKNINHTHVGSIGNLRLDLIKEKLLAAIKPFSIK